MKSAGRFSLCFLAGLAFLAFFFPSQAAWQSPSGLNSPFSSDGRRLLTADGRVAFIWNLETGKEAQRFQGHTEPLRTAVFNSDGRQVLTGAGRKGDLGFASTDNSARLWDAATGRELKRFVGHTGYVRKLQFSPDGKQVLTLGDQTGRLWDVNSGRQLFVWPEAGTLEDVTFSPNGRLVLGLQHSRITIWDSSSGTEISRMAKVESGDSLFDSAAFSPDNRFVLTASGDKTVRTWNVDTGNQVQIFVGHTSYVHQALYAFDGQKIVSASSDRSVRIWDAKSGKELQRFEHPGAISQIFFSANGKALLAKWSLEDKTSAIVHGASLWNAESGREIAQLTNGFEQIVGFSPVNEHFVTVTDGRPGALWDGATGRKIRQYQQER